MHRLQTPVWFVKVYTNRKDQIDKHHSWIMWADKGKVLVSPINPEPIQNIKDVILKGYSAGVRLTNGKKKQQAMQEWLLPYEI